MGNVGGIYLSNTISIILLFLLTLDKLKRKKKIWLLFHFFLTMAEIAFDLYMYYMNIFENPGFV